MSGRKVFVVVAGLVLAGVMSASMVHAKACPALCKVQIHTCFSTCSTLKGKEKRNCKKACKSHFIGECKASSSVPKERVCPASPSGAFVD